MSPLKLKIAPKPNHGREQSSKPVKRYRLSDDDFPNHNLSPSSSDREGDSQRTRDSKTRDTPSLNRRPSKKRRVVSDDDYEDGDLTPLPEEKIVKPKRETKEKVKTSTSVVSKSAKNERQLSSKMDDANANGIIASREDYEKADNTVTETIPDIPKKKKLPTIKKKPKPPGVVATTPALGTPSVTHLPSTKPQNSPPFTVGKQSMPVTTLNPSGSGDFDLRDSNTWHSLLGKKTTSSGPRVGIEKRVSTQERRKQLDEMREEARMFRNDQLKNTFDLQAQSQKIMQYEKTYAHHIQGAHILGAAFKSRLAG